MPKRTVRYVIELRDAKGAPIMVTAADADLCQVQASIAPAYIAAHEQRPKGLPQCAARLEPAGTW